MQRLIIFTVVAFLVSSCAKKHDCLDYAPIEKEVVWNDYNTVKKVNDNFRCYRASREEHVGDTLAVMGYNVETIFQYGAGGVHESDFGMHIEDSSPEGSLFISVPGEYFSLVQTGVVKYYYIIGKLFEGGVYDGGCCGYQWPAIEAFSIDTIPHYELLSRQDNE